MKVNELLPAVGKRGLFLSSSGGHFTELLYVANLFGAHKDSRLVTFDTPDTQGGNSKWAVTHLPYVPPRKFKPLILLLPKVFYLFRNEKYSYVCSTGAGLALVGYLCARRHRVPFVYVESVARQKTLSLTAKILQVLGLRYYFVQAEKLANRRRFYLDHPINHFVSINKSKEIDSKPLSIFIALGTIKGFPFERLVRTVLPLLRESDKVVWQLGVTSIHTLPGTTYDFLDRQQFLENIINADVIISHAGFGIITNCLVEGKTPIVMARRAENFEHVDNHQVEIAEMLAEKGLISILESNSTRNLLYHSASAEVVRNLDTEKSK